MSNGRVTETRSLIKGIRFSSTDKVQTLVRTNAVVRTAEEDTIAHPLSIIRGQIISNGTSGSTPTTTSGFERSARGFEEVEQRRSCLIAQRHTSPARRGDIILLLRLPEARALVEECVVVRKPAPHWHVWTSRHSYMGE